MIICLTLSVKQNWILETLIMTFADRILIQAKRRTSKRWLQETKAHRKN